MAWVLSKVPGLQADEIQGALGLTREVYDTFLRIIERLDWQVRQDMISGKDFRRLEVAVGGSEELERIEERRRG
jgi:hypothetical protein